MSTTQTIKKVLTTPSKPKGNIARTTLPLHKRYRLPLNRRTSISMTTTVPASRRGRWRSWRGKPRCRTILPTRGWSVKVGIGRWRILRRQTENWTLAHYTSPTTGKLACTSILTKKNMMILCSIFINPQ